MFGSRKQTRRLVRGVNRRPGVAGANGQRRWADRATLGKLAIALVATAATVALVMAQGPPFFYRIGQTVQRDIRAKIRFETVNTSRTDRLREQAAEAVPSIYSNNSRPIHQLEASVESFIHAIAAAETFQQLPAAIIAEWPTLSAESFNRLHSAIEGPEREPDWVAAVARVFERIEEHGVMDVESQPAEFRGGTRIQVLNPAADEPRTWDVAQVARTALVNDTGPLAAMLTQELPSSEVADGLFSLLAARLEKIPATLTYEKAATEVARQTARASVPVETDVYKPGELLVPQDQPITTEQIALLHKEHERFLAQRGPVDRIGRAVGLTGLVVALYALAGYYVVRFERRLANSLIRLVLLAALVLGTLLAAQLAHTFGWLHAEIVPMALTAMTLALAYSQQFALLITFGMGLLYAWMFGTGVSDFVVLTGGTAAAVLALTRVRSRTKLAAVGATAGLTYLGLTLTTGLLASQPLRMVISDGFIRFCLGLLSGVVMGGLFLPGLEKLFGIVTDISLLELSDVTHPLLQELMHKAPGTYNHSVSVATLAEAAAEQIGGNALVVRVGSYFHDIGKMLKPHYFVENQADSINRHNALNPALSTLIIIGHVKDGVDLAHQHHLPEPITDLIEQHHGTTLVEYFYREAARESEDDWEKEADVEEAAFRYPGPKPQNKEACVVMLADAVESASRTLSEPTPGRIEGLVHELTLKRLLDGQFDECGITFEEIGRIKDSLIKSLNAIYHGRVKYPEPRTA